jgi:hypothetical protein
MTNQGNHIGRIFANGAFDFLKETYKTKPAKLHTQKNISQQINKLVLHQNAERPNVKCFPISNLEL